MRTDTLLRQYTSLSCKTKSACSFSALKWSDERFVAFLSFILLLFKYLQYRGRPEHSILHYIPLATRLNGSISKFRHLPRPWRWMRWPKSHNNTCMFTSAFMSVFCMDYNPFLLALTCTFFEIWVSGGAVTWSFIEMEVMGSTFEGSLHLLLLPLFCSFYDPALCFARLSSPFRGNYRNVKTGSCLITDEREDIT